MCELGTSGPTVAMLLRGTDARLCGSYVGRHSCWHSPRAECSNSVSRLNCQSVHCQNFKTNTDDTPTLLNYVRCPDSWETRRVLLYNMRSEKWHVMYTTDAKPPMLFQMLILKLCDKRLVRRVGHFFFFFCQTYIQLALPCAHFTDTHNQQSPSP